MPSQEVERLLSLPRPRMVPEEILNDVLRKGERQVPEGMPEKLLPIQAEALWQAMECEGLFAPLAVGAGKTLVSLLLPSVVASDRPLILTRTGLVNQMKRMANQYMPYWNIRNDIEFFAYDWLSDARFHDYLSKGGFDLIIADEAHCVRNTHGINGSRPSARASRLWDYIVNERQGHCKFCAMSGTMADKSIEEYWSLAYMALGVNTPVPVETYERRALASVIDVDPYRPPAKADFKVWAGLINTEIKSKEPDNLKTKIRKGFRDILMNTPGVVVSQDASCNSSIDLIGIEGLECPATIKGQLVDLENLWVTPTGEYIEDAMHKVAWERRIAAGYYYEIDWPGKPDYEWLEARSQWMAYAHSQIGYKGLDSYARVRDWVKKFNPYQPDWVRWSAVSDRWPNAGPPRKTIHTSDYLVEFALDFTKDEDWLVFYDGRGIEEKLFEHGVEFYGRGTEPREDGYGTQFLSIDVHKEGRNLQRWSKMLVLTPPPSNLKWEQLIGRIHRQGQEEDTVEVYYMAHLPCFRRNMKKAVDRAHRAQDTEGMAQKLCFAYTNTHILGE